MADLEMHVVPAATLETFVADIFYKAGCERVEAERISYHLMGANLTLPDCDHVICLGAAKMLSYSDRHHASQLVNCWVSKASATQRAGRTGRVRPGNVYRLYSKALHDRLAEHDLSEVLARPPTPPAGPLPRPPTSPPGPRPHPPTPLCLSLAHPPRTGAPAAAERGGAASAGDA